MSNLFFEEDTLFDSHCHLNSPQFGDDLEQVVTEAVENGVEKIVDIGIDIESSKRAIANAKRFPGIVFACVGIDPQVCVWGNSEFEQKYFEQGYVQKKIVELQELIDENREFIVAVGETGIDNYYNDIAIKKGQISSNQQYASVQSQIFLFQEHIELGIEYDLPLSVHSRGAEQICLDIIREYPESKGVFHSFTGNLDQASQIVDQGWGLGVNGIVTFKNSDEIREMYKQLLGDNFVPKTVGNFYQGGIYFETDAPYLSPEGKRGEQNQPCNTKDVFEFLAKSLK